jgi:hypothetical protein
MATAVLRPGAGGRTRRRASGSSAGNLGPKLPGLSRAQSLLVAREVLYMKRTPALLYQLAVVPLTAMALMFLSPARNVSFGAFMPMFVMIGTLAGRNLMMWGYDGPGIRTLFLLPVSARDLVLTKNIGWFLSALLEAVVILGTLVALRTSKVLPHLPLVATGWLALALASGVLGAWISIRYPMRPPERGMGRRSPGGIAGVSALLAMFALTGALILAVIAVRALTPDAYDEVASVIVTLLAAIAGAGVWWIGIDRNADTLEQYREKMIDTLAKSSDA